MKYIKKFEGIEEEMKIGDYVLINISNTYKSEYRDFINSNLGRLVKIDPVEDVFGKVYDYEVIVKYNKIPIKLKNSFPINTRKRFLISNVVSFGRTPEDVEIRLNSNKYNL